MEETRRMAATLPELRRRTDLRALQRQAKRRGDLPNTVGLLYLPPTNRTVFELRPWSHC